MTAGWFLCTWCQYFEGFDCCQ